MKKYEEQRWSKDQNDITIPLDDDLDRYLKFLEKNKLVRNREDAALAALRIYKKLNMQDWLPYIYRTGTERVLIMGQSMLRDIFTSMSKDKLYDLARVSALKRRLINPMDPEIDFSETNNWDIILNELENLGWGKFTRDGDVIMVEFLGVSIAYLRGYLENLFGAEFKLHQTRSGDVYVLSKEKDKAQVWGRS